MVKKKGGEQSSSTHPSSLLDGSDPAVLHRHLCEELAALDAGNRGTVADAERAIRLELGAEHRSLFILEKLADVILEFLLRGVEGDKHFFSPSW